MPKISALLFLLLLSAINTKAQGQTRDSIVYKQRVHTSEYTNYINDTALRYKVLLEYKYSGSRGSTFRQLDIHPVWGYGYTRTRNISEEPELAPIPEPFYNAYREDVQYDTVYDHHYDQKGYAFTTFKYKKYDDSLLLLNSEPTWSPGQSVMERVYERDGKGRITKIQLLQKGTHLPQPKVEYEVYLSYNSQGYLVSDTLIKTTNEIFARTYEYDAGGRMTASKYAKKHQGSAWKYSLWNQYKYSATGKVTERFCWYMDTTTGNWDTIHISQLKYDAEDRLSTYSLTSHASNPASWMVAHYHYNSAGDIDTIRLNYPAQIITNSYHYNEYHLPDTIWRHYSYVGGQSIKSESRLVFTYEWYEDTIKASANALPLVLYPNPASTGFTIRWNKDNPRRPVYVSVYNMAGQLVKRTYIATPEPEDTVDAAALAPGVYVVQILSATGGKIYTGSLSIVK